MVLVNKVRFEDVKIAKQYITNKSVGFLFDLKAGYHHIDIFAPHQKYLGFSWKFEGVEKYYVFTVLPFGLKSSGYVFTKVLRPLVAHWRRKGIKIVVYLDDGLGLADDSEIIHIGHWTTAFYLVMMVTELLMIRHRNVTGLALVYCVTFVTGHMNCYGHWTKSSVVVGLRI
ncbi:uncharacterized protein LOC134710382 [Mytilus trossulus]|uniref:uncharacterized protein LOC134710382 n=1 Tax=Mytilus trossulus TaxID=6551 RepID=UPI0030078E5C